MTCIFADAALDMPARALARMVLDGRVRASELAAASLERARALASCNAFAFLLADQARAEAEALDRRIGRGETDQARLPLAGVPVAIKDLTPTEGVPTTLGSWSGGDTPAPADALLVRRLRAAGAIVIGKTTTPEFAHSSFTHSPRWGVTRNPRDPRRTPGGSSGGSGAAVAAGIVPLAEGTDMGGSVRIPAAFCGVVGLKPSLGRIPMDILPSLFDNLSHFGPLARRVDDAVLFMAAAAGPDDMDPFSLPLAFDEAAARRPAPLAGRQLALSADLGFFAVDADVRAAIEAAADTLRQAGAIVTPVALPWTREVMDRWTDLWGVFMAAYFGDRRAGFASRMDPAVLDLMQAGDALGAVAYKRVELVRSAMWRDLAPILSRHEALLCPTCAKVAPLAEARDDAYAATLADGGFAGLDMCAPFNMVPSLPVISLLAGSGAEGLPVGLQIAGRRYADEALLALAAEIEQALERM